MRTSIFYKLAQRVLTDPRFIYAPIILTWIGITAAALIWIALLLIAGSAPPFWLIAYPSVITFALIYAVWMFIYLWATSEVLIDRVKKRPTHS